MLTSGKKEWRHILHTTYKSSQEYPVNAGVPQDSILDPTLFLPYINDLPDDVICNTAIYDDDTTLQSKCGQTSDLLQQLELASELESNLWDTKDWPSKWLVDFSSGKTQLTSFDQCNNTGAIDMKMDGSILEENYLLRSWNWLSFSNCIGALTLFLLLKLYPRKLWHWFFLWSFFLLRFLCISINLPYNHVWNTAVMFWFVLLVATCNCWINYNNRYAGLLVLHLLPLLNLQLIVDI